MTFRSEICEDVIAAAGRFSNKKFIFNRPPLWLPATSPPRPLRTPHVYAQSPPASNPVRRFGAPRTGSNGDAGHILHAGFVDPAIHAVLPEKRVAGTAVTIRIPHIDSTLLNHVVRLIWPGDIVIVDRCGDTASRLLGSRRQSRDATGWCPGFVTGDQSDGSLPLDQPQAMENFR